MADKQKRKRGLLRVGDLQVEMGDGPDGKGRAQRIFRPGWFATLKAKYNRDYLGVIHVSRRDDGSLFVIDGQHRCRVVEDIEGSDTKVECCIYEHLTKDEEANLFDRLNDTNSVRAFDKFIVRRTAGDHVVVRICQIVDGLGLRIADQKGQNTINAVAALESVFTGAALRVKGEYGTELKHTLTLLRNAWGTEETPYDNMLIRGLGMLLVRHGAAIDIDRLAERMAKVLPTWVLARAQAKIDADRCQRAHAVAHVFTEHLYNKGLRNTDRKLPAWFRN